MFSPGRPLSHAAHQLNVLFAQMILWNVDIYNKSKRSEPVDSKATVSMDGSASPNHRTARMGSSEKMITL